MVGRHHEILRRLLLRVESQLEQEAVAVPFKVILSECVLARNVLTTVAGHQMWVSRSMSPHVIWHVRCVEMLMPILMSPAMARFTQASLTPHVRVWVAETSRVVRRIAIPALPTERAANTYPPATHYDAICIEALYNRIIVCMGVRANWPNQSGGRRD